MRVNIKFVIFVYHIAYIHYSFANLMFFLFRVTYVLYGNYFFDIQFV